MFPAVFIICFGIWGQIKFIAGIGTTVTLNYYTKTRSWNDAHAHCVSLGMSLAFINEDISIYIEQNIGGGFDDDVWIGVYDSDLSDKSQDKGGYSWAVDCRILSGTWTKWKSGEPQNTEDSFCAAIIKGEFKWRSDKCFERRPFLCSSMRLYDDNCLDTSGYCISHTKNVSPPGGGQSDSNSPHVTCPSVTTTPAPEIETTTSTTPTTTPKETTEPEETTSTIPTITPKETTEPEETTSTIPTTTLKETTEPEETTSTIPTTTLKETTEPEETTSTIPTTTLKETTEREEPTNTTPTTTPEETTERSETTTVSPLISESEAENPSPASNRTSSNYLTCGTSTCTCTESLPAANSTSGGSMEEDLQDLRAHLTLDKAKLSATRRKKESAPDSRPTSEAIATLSLSLVITGLAGLCALDVVRIYKDIRYGLGAHRRTGGTKLTPP